MLSQSKVNELNALFRAELAAAASSGRKSGKWECRLSETLVGEYSIIPLTSAKMLKSEGYLMNNCCRDYISQCEEREYCVFSIRRRTGERIATLGLKNEQGRWCFDQCFGPSNTDVLHGIISFLDDDGVLQTESFSTGIYYVAHEVARLINAAGDCH